MTINCLYDNINGTIDCDLPETFNTLTEKSDFLQSVQVSDKEFTVDQVVTYGDLMTSFLIFLILLIMIFKIIFKFFLPDTIRIKKHEL